MESLLFWRIHILFSILFVGVFLGFVALIIVMPMFLERQLWGLLAADTGLWGLGLVLLAVPGISFRVRTILSLLGVYSLALVIIINVGLLSGGPAALFAFSVLCGVLLGYRAALLSVVLNAVTLCLFAALTTQGSLETVSAFFDSPFLMVTSGATFIFLNAMAALSVSVLLRGVVLSNKKEKQLSASLTDETRKLMETRDILEKEIQKHRLTEEALYESEQKYRHLFNLAPAGMYEIDFTNFCFVEVNQLLCDFSGYSREEFLAMNPMDFLKEEDKLKFILRYEELKKGQIDNTEQEYNIIMPDGRELTVALSNDYLYTNGELKGARVVVHDLTRRKKIEEMMVQSEKMMSVGGLAAGMAHEINNPLAGILQNAQVIENRLIRDLPANHSAASALGTSMDVIKEFMEERGILDQLSRIREAGNRAARVVDNMLSFARKENASKNGHSLGALIDSTIHLAENDYTQASNYDFRQIDLVKEYAPDIPDVWCERSKIQQVLLNIIKNGYDAMSSAGTEHPQLIFRLKARTGMAVLEIVDNGPGMSPGVQKRIFEPFFTTKKVGVGTGLGLSVSYFIVVEDHEGELFVDSAPGKGSCFVVKLPLVGTAMTSGQKI
ncbi:MAG: PAS domain S-box protein [Desulfobacter sp.]|nr:MAG: PAS domain S-box protein [Desulfobacter sp.]